MHRSYISTFFVSLISILNSINSIYSKNVESVIANSTPDSYSSSRDVQFKMERWGIVPYIIPEPPQTIVDIAYKYYFSSVYLQNKGDDTIPHHKLSKLPTIHWMDCDPSKYYTLLMTFVNITNKCSDFTNFDKKCLENAKQYHHMLYTNIAHCNLRFSNEIFSYEPPPPNPNNETNIYVFSLMEQKNGKEHLGFKEKYNHYFFRDEDNHNAYRSNFTIKEFMEHFNAELLAGNYMRVVTVPDQQWDFKKYCPYVYIKNLFTTLKTMIFPS